MNTTLAHPWVLFALLMLPFLGYYFILPKNQRHRAATFMFSNAPRLSQQPRGWKARLYPASHLLPLLALGAMIYALARPQLIEAREADVEGIDIYLALDMSGSMQAIDLEQSEVETLQRSGNAPKNRFQNAVTTLKDLVRTRKHDRIGMTVFAKDAFLQFPLTLDRRTILDMLSRLRLGDIDSGGTAIGNALGRSVAGLKESEAHTKIIILITDGDRRGGNISPKAATAIAAEMGVKIYPILVGKEGMTLVPKGRNLFRGTLQYQQVEFPVNPDLLQTIARDSGGTYYRATDTKKLREGLHSILDQLEKTRLRDSLSVDPEDRFHGAVGWALGLLFCYFVLQYSFFRRFP
jgi:Ca-activated chloride channel homolog